MSPTVAAGTVAEALAAATDALRAAGVGTPRLDAELLLADAIGEDRATILAGGEEGVRPEAARRFGAMVRRRLRREPVAYILGRKAFRHIELEVDPRVLIPRPETELLVEVAVEVGPRTVFDVGTGSGAVALAVADEVDGVAVTGVDVSEGAIAVAGANAARLGLDATFSVGDLLPHTGNNSPIAAGRWDLLLANLPYVPDADWATLAPEIRDYEPREAVLGGPDGLDPIRQLLSASPACRTIALEVGFGQAATVERLVNRAGFPDTDIRPDLAGVERVVVGRRDG